MTWITTPIELRCLGCGIESKIRVRWMPVDFDSAPTIAEQTIAQKELSAKDFAQKHAACFVVPEDDMSERTNRPGGSSSEQMRSQVVPSPARGAPQDHPDHGRDPALGLYRVHWKSGDSSLAAIGMLPNGDRWLAPTNWVRPTEKMPWDDIERLELVLCRIPETSPRVYGPNDAPNPITEPYTFVRGPVPDFVVNRDTSTCDSNDRAFHNRFGLMGASDQAGCTYDRSEVCPFSVMMFSAEEGWQQYGVYDSAEEATEAAAEAAAGYRCKTAVVNTNAVLDLAGKHPTEPLWDLPHAGVSGQQNG